MEHPRPPTVAPPYWGRHLQSLQLFLQRAARVDASVLLVGETGTGKSFLARTLHSMGPRSDTPFVSVNVAGVPDSLFESEFFGHERGAFTGAISGRPGLFEQSNGGTLLLDEIGDLPLHQQAKLLSVLEERQVRRLGGTCSRSIDTRIISATCRDLQQDVRGGVFRLDLFHRVAVLRAVVPPLRERPDDIRGLIAYTLQVLCSRYRCAEPVVSGGAIKLLRRHSWPGNLRELAHVLEACLVLADRGRIGAGDVGRQLSLSAPPDAASSGRTHRYSFAGGEEEERAHIREALWRSRGNRTRAASALGMSRSTLREKIQRLRVDE